MSGGARLVQLNGFLHVPNNIRYNEYCQDGRMSLGFLGRRCLVFKQKESAFPSDCEIKIPVAVVVCNADLDTSSGPAPVVNHMPGPVDGVRFWVEQALIPVDSQRFALSRIVPVVGHVAFAGQQAEVSSLTEVYEHDSVPL